MPRFMDFIPSKLLCNEDEDFKEVVENPSIFGSFTLQDGFFGKGNKLSTPKSPLRDLIINEACGISLANNFGIDKTLKIIKEHFYWPRWEGCS